MSTTGSDYYSLLGLKKEDKPTREVISKAYKKLAAKYHPDRNRDNKEEAHTKFVQITAAYRTLTDPEKRQAYDRLGHHNYESHAATGGNPGADPFSGFGGSADFEFGSGGADFEDLFSSFFGGSSRRSRGASLSVDGEDLYDDIQLTLEEAAKGRAVAVKYHTYVGCTECKSTGSKDGSYVNCASCGGSGSMRMQQGMFIISKTCTNCAGAGKEIRNKCVKCNGEGRVQDQVVMDVNIPKGISHGQQVRVSNKGEAGRRGGRRGDFFIKVAIKKHAFYTREGNNLKAKVPIKLSMAILGGEITIPSIYNDKISLNIPQSTQNGKTITVSGKGMPSVNSGRVGDAIIELEVEIPVKLTKKQIDAIKMFDEDYKEGSSPNSEGFFDRIKRFFH